jgi:Uma2 family endonuclease
MMDPEEFDDVAEWNANYTYELINGVVIVSPAPAEGERGPNDRLGYLLQKYQLENPLGVCVDYTLPEQYVAGTRNRRRADRAIWIGLRRRPKPRIDVPAIVIEFVAKRKRDRERDYVKKREEYLKSGVREYWIIDRFRRTLTVFTNASEPRVFRESETYSTELLPAFTLSLDELLRAADQWD